MMSTNLKRQITAMALANLKRARPGNQLIEPLKKWCNRAGVAIWEATTAYNQAVSKVSKNNSLLIPHERSRYDL